MSWISDNAGWIMIASGLLTCTMIQAAFLPEQALRSMFGDSLEGPLAHVIVRNWAILVTLIGLLLIYSGWTGASRELVLIAAGISKIAFITLVLSQGRRYLRQTVALAIVVDALFVILFAIMLV